MKNDQFYIGQELDAVFFTSDGESYIVGKNAESITVVFQSGMHADIPYAKVVRYDGCVSMWCIHNLEGVFIKTETEVTSNGEV